MKDTTKRTRFDLYEQIGDIRNRFERLYKKHGTDSAVGYRAYRNYIELQGISRVVQFMTIKGMKMVVDVNKPVVEEMEEVL